MFVGGIANAGAAVKPVGWLRLRFDAEDFVYFAHLGPCTHRRTSSDRDTIDRSSTRRRHDLRDPPHHPRAAPRALGGGVTRSSALRLMVSTWASYTGAVYARLLHRELGAYPTWPRSQGGPAPTLSRVSPARCCSAAPPCPAHFLPKGTSRHRSQ